MVSWHCLAQVYWELLHVLYSEGLHQNVSLHKITKWQRSLSESIVNPTTATQDKHGPGNGRWVSNSLRVWGHCGALAALFWAPLHWVQGKAEIVSWLLLWKELMNARYCGWRKEETRAALREKWDDCVGVRFQYYFSLLLVYHHHQLHDRHHQLHDHHFLPRKMAPLSPF